MLVDDQLEDVPPPYSDGDGEQYPRSIERNFSDAELAGIGWFRLSFDPVPDGHRQTGEYTRVGTIERMSRFLDAGHEVLLFGGAEPTAKVRSTLVQEAEPFFPNQSREEIEGLILSCRRLEDASRHKANPNIPTLGERDELLSAATLSDLLPSS